jgi:hypothetical protein
MESVYHFSGSPVLPYVLRDGELRPFVSGASKVVWATTNPHSSAASSAFVDMPKEATRLVRFTLPADEFGPWREVLEGEAGWSKQNIEAMERLGLALHDDPDSWCVRVAALDLFDEIEPVIETRDWGSAEWNRIVDGVKIYNLPMDGGVQGIELAGRVYLSRKNIELGGKIKFDIWPSRPAEGFAA